MVKMTMQLPDELAKRIQPIRYWLPTISELSLVGFKTLAIKTATEIIQFFSTNPSPEEHFELEGAIIQPLTPEARVTVKLLRLNDEDRVIERRHLLTAGLYG